MRIAEVNGAGTSIIRYPLTFDDVKREALLIGWPENPTAATFADSRYRIVEEVAPPAAEFGESVQEGAPIRVNGAWRQSWTKSRITLAQAKQQLAQMVVDTYWERLLREPPVAEFQTAGRSGVAVLQGRSTRWTTAVSDVAGRIQAAASIDAAYAIFLEPGGPRLMPLGPALAVLNRRKAAGAAAPDYSSYGTIIYEARNAAGLSLPFDPSGITTTPTGSIACVFKSPSATTAYHNVGSGATGAADPGVRMSTQTTGGLRVACSDGTTLVQPSIGSGTIVTGVTIVGLIKWQNAGSCFVRIGANETSSSIAALGALGTDQMRVGNTFGAGGSAGLQTGGTIYHIIIFSTFVATLSALQTALNTDWGI